MTEHTTQGQSELIKPSLPIGIDVTMLLAASSFIEPFDGTADPRAKEAFTTVATAFCSGSPLLLPLPKNNAGHAPLFYSLWRQQPGGFASIPGVELSDEAFDQLIQAGRADEFEKYVEAFPKDFALWIAFQFTSMLSHGHVDRADPWVKERCEPIVARMIKERRFPRLRRQINVHVKKGELDCPVVYRHLLGTTFPDLPHLCIAYAMSVVLRGFSYAIAIGSHEHAAPPLYCHHWVRDRIVNTFENNGIECERSLTTLRQFPWGAILGKVFDPKKPLESTNPSKVKEVLLGIREQSPKVADALKKGLFAGIADTQKSDRISAAELQVADWLKESGVVVRRRSKGTSLLEGFFEDIGGLALSEAAKELTSATPGAPEASAALLGASVAAVILKPMIVERIATIRQSSFWQSLDYRTHVVFCRNSFWKRMEDPGIREAVRRLE